MWVEKILHTDEALRDWPVEGTVGYEFLNDATALFVDPAGAAPLAELAARRRDAPFDELALEAQLQQATTTFAREVARLRTLQDMHGIADALAALPVYRTYVEPASGRVEADEERRRRRGRRRLADVLALRERGHDELVARFQQSSPPVTAKGVEDTALYRDLRLLALNEVGGDPARFGLSVEAFHAPTRNAPSASRAGCSSRRRTTRSARATCARGSARSRDGGRVGDAGRGLGARGRRARRARAYLLFQTLVGAWPIEPERLEAYLEKALREAKLRTGWTAPDEAYEAPARRHARALVERPPEGFDAFAARVAARARALRSASCCSS